MPTAVLAPDAIISSTNLSGDVPGPLFAPNGVVFDGTSDYLNKTAAFTGVADSQLWTFACSLMLNAVGTETAILRMENASAQLRARVYVDTAGALQFQGRDTGGTNRVLMASSNTLTTGQWYSILFSCNLAVADSGRLYIDDVDRRSVTTYSATNTIVFSTLSNIGLGARHDGLVKLNGELCDVWSDFGRYVDFDVESNRRKFFLADGRVVDKGSDGSTPFGAAPIIFFSGATNDWHTNKGTGGGMTLNGAITDSPVNPVGA